MSILQAIAEIKSLSFWNRCVSKSREQLIDVSVFCGSRCEVIWTGRWKTSEMKKQKDLN